MSKDTKLEFPCEFIIKVMGRKTPEFEATIIPIFRKHAPDLGEAAISIRESRKGNYISLTVKVNAKSKEHLDAIYMELTACDLVIMAL